VTLWTAPSIPDAPCPSCAGSRVDNLNYRHVATCPLHTLDDGTRANDWQALNVSPRARMRATTVTELTLAASLGWTPAGQGSVTLIDSGPPNLYRRRILETDLRSGFDPDLTEGATP